MEKHSILVDLLWILLVVGVVAAFGCRKPTPLQRVFCGDSSYTAEQWYQKHPEQRP